MKNKNFLNWHCLKKKIHESPKSLYFHEREIWFCSLGLNVGYEQDGWHNNFERPVLILKKFNQRIFLAIPLTSKNKKGKYYYQFTYKNKKYSAILSQLRLLDSKRLSRKIRVLPKLDFEIIKKGIKKLI